MLRDKVIFSAHALGMTGALALAMLWPRPGEAALIAPLGPDGISRTLAWAAHEQAGILALDERARRVVVMLPRASSVSSALRSGLVPIMADARACAAQTTSLDASESMS